MRIFTDADRERTEASFAAQLLEFKQRAELAEHRALSAEHVSDALASQLTEETAIGYDDASLADEIIARLNKLVADPIIRNAIHDLIETRIPCSLSITHSETIITNEDEEGQPVFGFLDLLNGLVGKRTDIEGKWGYIAASFDDDMRFTHFCRSGTPK